MEKILALDLGSNSIGWALINLDEDLEEGGIEAAGVRIFPKVTEDQKDVPKNQNRRVKRGMRKTFARRRMRLDQLFSTLVESGLLPKEGTEHDALFSDFEVNPYLLRKRALDERLELHEVGRAIYHICRRRGFKSNRKTKLGDLASEPEVLQLILVEEAKQVAETEAKGKKKKGESEEEDEGKILSEISALRAAIKSSGNRTLGEHLYHLLEQGETVRRKHTDRSMYEEEFELIWESQRRFHPDQMTSALKADVYHAIFFQRPLKPQRFLVGECLFFPNRKRAAWGWPIAQEFRMWQELNNLEWFDKQTYHSQRLTQEQRQSLFDALQKQAKISLAAARKLLKLPSSAEFNLEAGGRKELKGNYVHLKLVEATGGTWDRLSPTRQDDLIRTILEATSRAELYRTLKSEWGFSARDAYALAILELPTGYASVSVKAMRQILPHMRQGLTYAEAWIAAGLKPREIIAGERRQLTDLPATRNPVVDKALCEVRKVVNAIVREYGIPEIVRIEMARDMKMSRKDKEEASKRNRENEKLNQIARKWWQDMGVEHPSRNDLIKHRLWQECGEICPYTGQAISGQMLKDGLADIEHIIPYSRCLDDSFTNLTLCMSDENRMVKRNKTPYEAYGDNPQRFAEILKRVYAFSSGLGRVKAAKFEMTPEQVEERYADFAERQMNDTRYICRLVAEYLAPLGCKVQLTKGAATGVLRKRWGLHNLLGGGSTDKKQRDDHRHHAVDAIVIGCTTVGLMHRLSRLSAIDGLSLNDSRFKVPLPWKNIRDDAKRAIEAIVVSHAPTRKIMGALHEGTAYGYLTDQQMLVYRKPLSEGLSDEEVGRIRDPKIRDLVRRRIQEVGDAKKAFADESQPLTWAGPSGREYPVRRVRILKPARRETLFAIEDRHKTPYKYFLFGNNHHVEIFEDPRTGKREGRFVNTMEAARRVRKEGRPIVDRTPPKPGWRFVMSLAINDLVRWEDGKTYRVQSLDPAGNRVWLRLATAATLDNNAERILKSISLLRCPKLTVDPIGKVSECHD